MAVTEINIIAALVLSLFTIAGVCGEPVTCKTQGATVQFVGGKTASSNDYKFVTHVPQFERARCHDRCKTYCKDEGPRGFDVWPNCVAFSSYVERGGTCYCYGWTSKPSWYDDSGYNSGWCEK